MTNSTVFLYLMVVGWWVFGIAVAVKYYSVMWVLVAVTIPPAAWVMAAKWLLERFA